MRGYFGFEELHIPAHVCQPLPVDVVFEPITGGPVLPAVADPLALRHQGIWYNAVRNRRVARLARGLHAGDTRMLRKFKRVLNGESFGL